MCEGAPPPLSHAQAIVVRDLWRTGRWSVLEIAHYLGVSPFRINTAQAATDDE